MSEPTFNSLCQFVLSSLNVFVCLTKIYTKKSFLRWVSTFKILPVTHFMTLKGWNVAKMKWNGPTNIEKKQGWRCSCEHVQLLMHSCRLVLTVETKPSLDSVVKVSADGRTISFDFFYSLWIVSSNHSVSPRSVVRSQWIPSGVCAVEAEGVSVVLFRSEKLLQQHSSAVVWTQSCSLICQLTWLNPTLYKAVKVWLRKDQLFKESS